jgi:hypothetical protein
MIHRHAAAALVFAGSLILAQAAVPPKKPVEPPKTTEQANPPPARPRSPSGGADLRANNPFAVPKHMRPPFSTSGDFQ